MTPLRIFHIVRRTNIGGSEMLVKNIINANDDLNFSHSLVYSFNGPLLVLIKDSKKSNLIHCRYGNPLIFIFNLRRIIRMNKTDIIHTHQPADVIYSCLASVGLKVKIVRTYHGYEGINRNKPGFSYKMRFIYFFINRIVSLNLFVSSDLLNYYRFANPGQTRLNQKVLYNGVNLKDLSVGNETNIRLEKGISSESILLGMIGGFNTKGRDHITICKALKFVLKINPDMHFLFIGKITGKFPKLYNNCLDYCKQNGMLRNVHFIGERNDVGGILKELDLYVHSSNNETFGISLVEAILSGVPCIASDIPPFREVSDNGKYLTLFEKGNAEDLYDKIYIELNNLQSAGTKERINNARAFADKNFSIQVHLKNLHNLYHECLK